MVLAEFLRIEYDPDPFPMWILIAGAVGTIALAGFMILGITWLLNLRHDRQGVKRPPD